MDYHLKPPSKECAASGRPFEPGELVYSVVVDRDGQLLRFDYSEDGWSGSPEDSVGEWTTLFPDQGPKQKSIDTEGLMRYFEQLCEDANPGHDQMRYVLALLLLQKRRLRLEGTRRDEDGNEFLEWIGSKSEGPFEVPDQALDEDEIANLQTSLNAQLAEEWN